MKYKNKILLKIDKYQMSFQNNPLLKFNHFLVYQANKITKYMIIFNNQ
jgi:hypothetical protein